MIPHPREDAEMSDEVLERANGMHGEERVPLVSASAMTEALYQEIMRRRAVERACDRLLAAGKRMLPSPEMMAKHADAPDDERIDLLTSWGAVRHLLAAIHLAETGERP